MLRYGLLVGLLLSSCGREAEATQESPPPAPGDPPPSVEPAAKAPAATAAQEQAPQRCIQEETEYLALHGKTRDGRSFMSPEDAQNYAQQQCGMQLRTQRGGGNPPREGPPTPFVPPPDNLRVNQSTRPLPGAP